MDITREDYQVQYDEAAATVRCSGSFRLHGDEYKPMLDLLGHAADIKSAMLTLDLRELQFLLYALVVAGPLLLLGLAGLATARAARRRSDRRLLERA